ncbi:MAG: acyl-CoA dehydrogenase family protein [Actinomycetota bacterium]
MDLNFTPEEEAFRVKARAWLEGNAPAPMESMDTPDGFEQHRDWEEHLYEHGWAAVSWPREFGGRDATLIEWLIFEEEYYRVGAPRRLNQNGLFLLGPVLLEYGTKEQKERYLPKIVSAEEIWCQGWSEPNAGSDLASLTSKATRDGDEWVLTGQKTGCSRGVYADWMFGLFRSDPSSERHKGLSYILVPLESPGVTVRPIAQIDGEPGFAEVFLDNVRVPVANTLGPEGEGWQIAMSTAGFERGVALRSPGRFMASADRLVSSYMAREHLVSPSLRNDVINSWMDVEAYRLYTFWSVSRKLAGGTIGAEASLNKVWWSEMDVRLHDTALRLLGEDATLPLGDEHWLDGFLFSLAGPIYAGTNEIQRNIIAERVLGLPRS